MSRPSDADSAGAGEGRGEGEALLRARFAELRRRDQRGVPDFERMWNAPRRRPSPWRVAVPVGSLAAAAALVLWCGGGLVLGDPPSSQADAPPTDAVPAGAVDPAPLDFLLEMPVRASLAQASELDTNSLERW